MNDQLDSPQCIKNYGKSGVKADTSIIDEKEFLEKLPERPVEELYLITPEYLVP